MMKQWIKTKILDWLTAPVKEKDVKFDDPVPPGHIKLSELTDVVFEQPVVMTILGKDKDGKWVYFARPKFKRENTVQ